MAKFTTDKTFSAARPTALLRSANVEVTQRCDSRCVSCNIWRMQDVPLQDSADRNNKVASFDELACKEHINVFDQLFEQGCRAVQLHGGEPLLNSHLDELVAHCSNLGIFTGTTTNGLSMTADRAAALVTAGLGSIKFSLDGPRELHNRLRGRQDAFEKQINAITFVQEKDKEKRVYKSIRTNVSSVNLDRIDEVLDIAHSLSIQDVQFAFYSVIDEHIVEEANEIFQEKVASRRSIIPSDLLPKNVRLIEKKRQRLKEKAKKLGIHLAMTRFFTLPASEVPKGIKRTRKKCRVFDYSCTIDAFGQVVPCEYLRFPMGNIRNRSLKEIRKSQRYHLFRKLYEENYMNLRICDYCCLSL